MTTIQAVHMDAHTFFVFFFIFLFSFVVGWGAIVTFGILIGVTILKFNRELGGEHDASLTSVEILMWWIELNTAFYLPFAHEATPTATLITSIIDATAEFYELGQSLLGHTDIEIGDEIILRPGASEEDIMWSHMTENACKFVNITMSRQDDMMKVQRFVMLLNYYSLEGAGPWSNMTTPENWELEVKTGIGKIKVYK